VEYLKGARMIGHLVLKKMKISHESFVLYLRLVTSTKDLYKLEYDSNRVEAD
jgi:hypothetical protein